LPRSALSLWIASALLNLAQPAIALDLAELARRTLGADQGVYVEAADGTVLVAQVAARAVHPASISKIPTTLALLRRFGPEHRFVTTFSAAGRIENGALRGDLVVEPGGDPYLSTRTRCWCCSGCASSASSASTVRCACAAR
jgi:D-alanyl-D-alanine carboxypeptidase/D-alanyl-D-alanine-endopeptidase (penicillin-binding protein 4)